jgi:hypothetical protein
MILAPVWLTSLVTSGLGEGDVVASGSDRCAGPNGTTEPTNRPGTGEDDHRKTCSPMTVGWGAAGVEGPHSAEGLQFTIAIYS